MKVIDTLGEEQIISVEIEPPTLGSSIEGVFRFLDPLVDLGIRYIDITYHPEQIIGWQNYNGERIPISQRKKPGTLGVAGAIKWRYSNQGVEPVPHAICTGFKQNETEEYLVELAYLDIENLVALRGDSPKGPDGASLSLEDNPLGHSHANELIEQINRLRKGIYVGAKEGEHLSFCIGAASYPEFHPDSESLEDEVHWARVKVDAGADYLVTQMFFDNTKYWEFVARAREAGITVPIIPGIKPLTIYRHLEILPNIFGCSIPKQLRDEVERHKNNPDYIRQAGIEACIQQCLELRELGAPSLHFYAARKTPIEQIIDKISQLS